MPWYVLCVYYNCLQVPSWRFPEKLATSLDAEELVRRTSHCGSEREDCSTHALLLELTVDRYMWMCGEHAYKTLKTITGAPSN